MFSPRRICFLAFVYLFCAVCAFEDNEDILVAGFEVFAKIPHGLGHHSYDFNSRYEKAKSVSDYHHRLLLQQYSCEWAASDATCVLSVDSIFELLTASSSPTAQMVVDRRMCGLEATESGCGRHGFCLWDGQECFLFDYSVGNEQSPCVQHAPATIEYYAALLRCPLETSSTSCSRINGCFWNENLGLCVENGNRIFFGYDSVGDRSNEELLNLVEADGDRDFIEMLFDCFERTSAATCTGTCHWSTDSERCVLSRAAIIHAITVNSGGSHDPVCGYFSMLEESGCYVTSTVEECEANDNCVYNDGCFFWFGFLLQWTANEDPEFGDAFNNAANSCDRFTTEATCF